jgi:hypothetical protein
MPLYCWAVLRYTALLFYKSPTLPQVSLAPAGLPYVQLAPCYMNGCSVNHNTGSSQRYGLGCTRQLTQEVGRL